MAGILDLLNSDIGKTLIKSASAQLGQKEDKTVSALSTAFPLILGGMKNNVSTQQGASGLLKALSSSNHDGSIFDNLGDLLGSNDLLKDGSGILGHIFGGKEQTIAKAVSTKSGMDLNSVMKLLQMAAPLIMGYLGKQTRQQNVNDSNGIENLLGGLLGSSSQNEQSLVTKLLDADGDGNIIDDLMNMASGTKKGGIGGILGGLFGGK